jgi:small GTP-binding protein
MPLSPEVQWSFLQYRRQSSKVAAPTKAFLCSTTQIGSKLLVYGGCNFDGKALSQLFLYDTSAYFWNSAKDDREFQEDHPGPRYGHSATLVDMHPPRLMIFGGIVGGGTFEFEAPNGLLDDASGSSRGDEDTQDSLGRSLMSSRRGGKGTQRQTFDEETDDRVYFLELQTDKWVWKKPMIHGDKRDRPDRRTEHSASKIGTNQVAIFGGWTVKPESDLWVLDYVNMEWNRLLPSGIPPKPRYRHTSVVHDGSLYIMGGSDTGADEIRGTGSHLGIHKLSLSEMQWTHPDISGSNPFPRSGHCSSLVGSGSVAIFGGKRSNIEFLNDLHIIDLGTFVGLRVNVFGAQLPTPISNATMSVINNKVFVFGGTDAKGLTYSDLRAIDLADYMDPEDITVGEGATSDYSFKMLIIGDAAVGKSSLLTRFSENVFMTSYQSTIGIDFSSKMIRVDKAICKLEIWDTAGQERFSTITANYYRGAQGALVVYDVGDRQSFIRANDWFKRAKELGGEAIEAILVGNKSDLEQGTRRVSTEEGQDLAAVLGIPFVETSALRGTNVERAFVSMTQAVKNSVDRRGLVGVGSQNLASAGGVNLANRESGMTMREKCCT